MRFCLNQTSLFGFVTAVTWIPIRNLSSAMRDEVLDQKKSSQTIPVERYITLH
jgi:hypothetical protein